MIIQSSPAPLRSTFALHGLLPAFLNVDLCLHTDSDLESSFRYDILEDVYLHHVLSLKESMPFSQLLKFAYLSTTVRP